MLTPASNDPNRKNELARKKEHPETFGVVAIQTRQQILSNLLTVEELEAVLNVKRGKK